MPADPAPTTIRSEDYLQYIREQRCVACHSAPPNDPHHLESGGMGTKSGDRTAVPLCRTSTGSITTRDRATWRSAGT